MYYLIYQFVSVSVTFSSNHKGFVLVTCLAVYILYDDTNIENFFGCICRNFVANNFTLDSSNSRWFLHLSSLSVLWTFDYAYESQVLKTHSCHCHVLLFLNCGCIQIRLVLAQILNQISHYVNSDSGSQCQSNFLLALSSYISYINLRISNDQSFNHHYVLE